MKVPDFVPNRFAPEASPNQGGKKSKFFAPLNVPMARRWQTLAVLIQFTEVPICICVFLFFMTPVGWLLAVPYLVWALMLDKAPFQGGRPVAWVRENAWTRCIRDYFPVNLHVASDAVFPTDKNYLFGCHPHGLICCGLFSNFVSESDQKRSAFPGLSFRVHTMEVNFRIPLFRDLLLALGHLDVSRKSLLYQMGRVGGGNVSCLVPGGAEESLTCTEHILTLKKRKGFVKIAMETGACLVPVFTFGEVELFTPIMDPSKTRGLLYKIQKALHVGTPLVNGRGVFNYRAGILPHRVALNTIVGKPIIVKNYGTTYTPADVDAVHGAYMVALLALYDANKAQFDPEGKYPTLVIN